MTANENGDGNDTRPYYTFNRPFDVRAEITEMAEMRANAEANTGKPHDWIEGLGYWNEETASFLAQYTEFVVSKFAATTVFEGPIALRNMAAMGLAGESGEVVDLIKKLNFHNYSDPDDPEFLEKISKELGDVFWYWTAVVFLFNLDPTSIITANVNKLIARHGADGFDSAEASKRYNTAIRGLAFSDEPRQHPLFGQEE